MTQSKRLGSYTARQNLMTHPRYRYRGCAPDVDDASAAAGNLGVPVTAWEAPDVDGGESQAERRAREAAAVEVCVDCPVMVQCLAFGASLNPAGRLAVPHGVLGGMTALERHKAFVRERQVEPAPVRPAPDEQLKTEQKLAVLRALAVHVEPEAVASAAGVDVRTAQWQRSRLTTQLGLPKSATRAQVLEAAVARGLLDPGEVVGQLSLFPSAPALRVAA